MSLDVGGRLDGHCGFQGVPLVAGGRPGGHYFYLFLHCGFVLLGMALGGGGCLVGLVHLLPVGCGQGVPLAAGGHPAEQRCFQGVPPVAGGHPGGHGIL